MNAEAARTLLANNLGNGQGWQKLFVTVLDAPDNTGLTPGSPLPPQFAWADVYVSAFGRLHGNATNYLLTHNMPSNPSELIDWVGFHTYPHDWYQDTIEDPGTTGVGFAYSPEEGGLPPSGPSAGSFFLQSAVPAEEFVFAGITQGQAAVEITRRHIAQTEHLLTLLYEPISSIGLVDASELADGTLKLVLTEGSPAFAWLDVAIPADAQFMAFDYQFTSMGDGDFLTVSLGAELAFVLRGDFFEGTEFVGSEMLDVANLAGQSVPLSVGLNSVGDANAEVVVQNMQFFSEELAYPGDFDGDGRADIDDVGGFVLVLLGQDSDPNQVVIADMNRDGAADGNDVQLFINVVLAS